MNWPQAPYKTKAETDANFKRMLVEGFQPENLAAVRLGIASHNLVLLQVDLVLLEPLHPGDERLVLADPNAHGQRAEEEPDHRLDSRQVGGPAGEGGSEQHVILPEAAAQEESPHGLEDGARSQPVLAGQGEKRRSHRLGQLEGLFAEAAASGRARLEGEAGGGRAAVPGTAARNIGVAMGIRGSQVAREAADMILKDDAFSSIVVAVEEGRGIFNNIRKFVVYLLSANASEILTVFVASLLNWPLPLLPLQILFLNIVNDAFPALALGVGRGGKGIMKQPPRNPKEPILTKGRWWSIFAYGGLITAPVLASLWIATSVLGMDATKAVTVSFLTLAFAQLWHVFNMRDPDSGLGAQRGDGESLRLGGPGVLHAVAARGGLPAGNLNGARPLRPRPPRLGASSSP